METHVFVSDLPIDPETAKLYRCRWRIETNNRELKKFMPWTTSRSMKPRWIYYSLAALLYNLWTIIRNMVGSLRSYESKNILSVRLNAATPQFMFEGDVGPPP